VQWTFSTQLAPTASEQITRIGIITDRYELGYMTAQADPIRVLRSMGPSGA
jgi:hypothetical protein